MVHEWVDRGASSERQRRSVCISYWCFSFLSFVHFLHMIVIGDSDGDMMRIGEGRGGDTGTCQRIGEYMRCM